MTKDFRSMAEAEKKEWGISKIVMIIATAIIFSLSYFNLFHTNLYMWQKKADIAAQVIGGVLYGLSIAPVLAESYISRKLRNEYIWWMLWIGLMLAGILTSCGFNFDL